MRRQLPNRPPFPTRSPAAGTAPGHAAAAGAGERPSGPTSSTPIMRPGAHLADDAELAGQRGENVEDAGALHPGVGLQAVVEQVLEVGERPGRHERVAAERRDRVGGHAVDQLAAMTPAMDSPLPRPLAKVSRSGVRPWAS